MCVCVKVSRVQLFVTPWTTHFLEFFRPEYWSGLPFPSPGNLPNPEIKHRSPALQADSLSAKPQWKRKNTGVGSPSLLHGISPAQESNPDLLHCRQILYQLSYQGSQLMVGRYSKSFQRQKRNHFDWYLVNEEYSGEDEVGAGVLNEGQIM